MTTALLWPNKYDLENYKQIKVGDKIYDLYYKDYKAKKQGKCGRVLDWTVS